MYRIDLSSTFLTSLFIGSSMMSATPFDLTDACGMNMRGIFTSRDGDPRILNVMCGGDGGEVIALRQKLGLEKPQPRAREDVRVAGLRRACLRGVPANVTPAP